MPNTNDSKNFDLSNFRDDDFLFRRDPFTNELEPVRPDPAQRNIVIHTEWAEEPILFFLCNLGAHLGFMTVLLMLLFGGVVAFGFAIVFMIEFTGSNFLGVLITFSLPIALQLFYDFLKKRFFQR